MKKETPTKVFSCEIYENFKDIFFKEDLRATTSVTWRTQSTYGNVVIWSQFYFFNHIRPSIQKMIMQILKSYNICY